MPMTMCARCGTDDRLRERFRASSADVEHLAAERDEARAEVERLRADLQASRHQVDEMLRLNDEQQAEVERLRRENEEAALNSLTLAAERADSGPALVELPIRTETQSFAEAWAAKEAAGYRYGADALENVELGWDMAIAAIRTAEIAALRARAGEPK